MKKRLNQAQDAGRRILGTKFIKRSKTIFLGTLISQLITFSTSFIITSYYAPEDLGLIGTLTALISIVAGTFIFRLDLAIIQAPENKAFETFLKATLLSCGTTLIFCLICLILPWDWSHKISDHFIPFLLWTWGYFLFFNSKQLPFRFDKLEDASKASIWRSIYAFATQLLGGITIPSFNMLLTSRISSDYFGSIFHLRRFIKEFKFSHLKGPWLNFIKHHSEFFIYMTPQHLCSSVSQNIIILFIERRFGLFEAGIFALSQRLIQSPLEMIGGTLVNVSVQRYSELRHNSKDLNLFFIKLVLLALGLACLMGVSIYLSIDFLVPLLGEKWSSSATTIKYLIPYFMSLILLIPAANILRMTKQSHIQLVIEVVEVLLKILLLTAFSFESVEKMILSYGLLSLGLSFIKTILIFQVIKKAKLESSSV